MALKTFVLISTVNNLSDARYCAGMNVNLIGFNLEANHSHYVGTETFNELTEWLSGVEYVGEFNTYTYEQIIETAKTYGIRNVEISKPELIVPLKEAGLTTFLRTTTHHLEVPDTMRADYIILENATQEVSDQVAELIKARSSEAKFLLAFGVTDENVEELITQTGIYGIALRGGDEIKPGFKDYDELADILEVLEIDDLA